MMKEAEDPFSMEREPEWVVELSQGLELDLLKVFMRE